MKRGAEGQEAKRKRSQWLAVIREAAGGLESFRQGMGVREVLRSLNSGTNAS